MKKNNIVWHVGVFIMGGLVITSAFMASRRSLSEQDLTETGPIVARSQEVIVGGVKRPFSDVSGLAQFSGSRKSGSKSQNPFSQSDPHPYGTTPMLAPDLNPSTTKSFAELQSSEEYESGVVSAFSHPQEFDAGLYETDKQSYLAISVPGRVWQTSQPGEGVPVLSSVSRSQQRMKQGETVRLQVRSAPNSPVTFTSFDLGAFSNGLASITVEADDTGLATTNFSAPSGTAYAVNLLAGSPMATGHVRFRINVKPPTR
jgi:hypothetical protein